MKSLRWLIICLLLVSSEISFSKDKTFGAGVMLGTLSSINGKYWFSDRDAMDFGIGFAGYPGAFFYADYLYNLGPIFATSPQFWRETSAYIGGGGGVGFWRDSTDCGRWRCTGREYGSGSGVFLRGFFGMEWMPSSTRFGVFGEGGLTILVTPGVSAGVDASIGGRYYF
jgi:hypothetical protein